MLIPFIVVTVVTCLILVLLAVKLFSSVYKVTAPSPDASFFSNIVLGHRGCMIPQLDIAENSLESLRFALEHGVDGIELDVLLSSDGELMVFHDTHTVYRVCDLRISNDCVNGVAVNPCAAALNKKKKVSQMTREQLQTSFRYRKGSEQERIPTLEEFLSVMYEKEEHRHKVVMIEVKEYGKRSREAARKIVQLYARYPFLYRQSVVASFSPMFLSIVRQYDANIVTNLLVRRRTLHAAREYIRETKRTAVGYNRPIEKKHKRRSILRQCVSYVTDTKLEILDYVIYRSMISWMPRLIGAGVIGIHHELAHDISLVRQLQQQGYVVNVWSVNSTQQKRTLEDCGGIAITSDYLFYTSENDSNFVHFEGSEDTGVIIAANNNQGHPF